MSGASYNHNVITTNILSTLHSKLRDTKYMPFGSDMRMYVSENGLFTYPDISVYESDVKVYDKEEDTVLYPVVIIEVLSEATQGYDRSDKFRLYRDISSLKDYILASQDEIAVEHFTKQSDGKWLLNEIKEKNGKVILDSINVTLDINDFYYKIKF
jgi:Uma2 family endonuclease